MCTARTSHVSLEYLTQSTHWYLCSLSAQYYYVHVLGVVNHQTILQSEYLNHFMTDRYERQAIVLRIKMRIIHKYDRQLAADISFKISCFQLTIILHPLYYFPASYPHRQPRNPRRHPSAPPDHVPLPSHPWCTFNWQRRYTCIPGVPPTHSTHGLIHLMIDSFLITWFALHYFGCLLR